MCMHQTMKLRNIWSKNTHRTRRWIDKSSYSCTLWNTHISLVDRKIRETISKDTEELNNSLYQLNLTDLNRTRHHQKQSAHSFQVARGSFNTDIWGYKTNLNKCKTIEIIQNLFSDHSGIKLEMKQRHLENSPIPGN